MPDSKLIVPAKKRISRRSALKLAGAGAAAAVTGFNPGAGFVRYAQAQSSEPIRIGWLTTLTGPLSGPGIGGSLLLAAVFKPVRVNQPQAVVVGRRDAARVEVAGRRGGGHGGAACADRGRVGCAAVDLWLTCPTNRPEQDNRSGRALVTGHERTGGGERPVPVLSQN